MGLKTAAVITYKYEGIIPAEGGKNMCKLKSAIILKDRIFMPDYDSISDNATFKDCYSKTIYQAGGWKFVEVKNNK